MATISQHAIYAEHLIKNSMDFIGAADENGSIIEYNPAALRAFGYTLEEMKTLDLHELYVFREEYEKVVMALEETGHFVGEVTNKRKNGESFICYLSANLVYNDEGVVIGSMGISRDISHEKELSNRVKEQSEKNAKLIEELVSLSRIATNVTNGVVVSDPEGRMKWCNDSFSRITGYAHNEMIGFRPSELFKVPHFYEETYKNLIEKGPLFNVPMQIPHYDKSGKLYWILVESTPVYNDRGELIEIIEICSEITDQKRAEMALAESEENFRQMSETIEDVVFLYNVVEKKYEYVSPNSSKMMGIDPDFFYTGRAYLNKFVVEEDRHLIRRGRMDLMSGKAYDVEYRISLDHEIKWLHERAFPYKDQDGDLMKASGIVSDITQFKRDSELIDNQNRKIDESITYAQRIQKSTLQDEDDVQRVFKESFVYFRPIGKLSGDFYIAEHVVTNNRQKLPVFVVADCTGHGVPGAILSILCISLIKQAFGNRAVNSPAEALDTVRNQLAKLFHTDDSFKIEDGMDVGMVVILEETKQIHFSGAKMNAYLYRNKTWIELTGSKQHVGFNENPIPFTNVLFDYESGDQIYLFTDGFVDQFGGDHNKKYMKRKLLDFVASIAHEPMEIQRKMIELEFITWKGNEEQTDDICCLGVRLA